MQRSKVRILVVALLLAGALMTAFLFSPLVQPPQTRPIDQPEPGPPEEGPIDQPEPEPDRELQFVLVLPAPFVAQRFFYINFPGESALIERFGREGDFIFVGQTPLGGNCPTSNSITSIKKQFPNMQTAYGFNSIDDIERCISDLPDELDYVSYDYEPSSEVEKHAPEFNVDQQRSIEIFEEVRYIVNQNGKKLLVTPPYIALERVGKRQGDWNYSEIIKYVDAIDVQIQAFIIDTDKIVEIATKLAEQMKSRPPGTLLFLQLSLTRGTLQNNLNAISSLEHLGIDGILVFHSPEHMSDMESLLAQYTAPSRSSGLRVSTGEATVKETITIFKTLIRENDMVVGFAGNLDCLHDVNGSKAVGFSSLSDLESNLESYVDKVSHVVYNIEESASPENDMADPLASVSKAAEIVHGKGLKLILAPSSELSEMYASDLAPFADVYVVQNPRFQDDEKVFVSKTLKMSSDVRNANPEATIIAQLSTETSTLPSLQSIAESIKSEVDGFLVVFGLDQNGFDRLKNFFQVFS